AVGDRTWADLVPEMNRPRRPGSRRFRSTPGRVPADKGRPPKWRSAPHRMVFDHPGVNPSGLCGKFEVCRAKGDARSQIVVAAISSPPIKREGEKEIAIGQRDLIGAANVKGSAS